MGFFTVYYMHMVKIEVLGTTKVFTQFPPNLEFIEPFYETIFASETFNTLLLDNFRNFKRR